MFYFTIITLVTLCLNGVSCYYYGRDCPDGLVRKPCSGGCSKQCGFWNSGSSCRPCKSGCVCPAGNYETWDTKFQVKCVNSADKCRCPRGQVYNPEGSGCTLTCSNPNPTSGCEGQKVGRCECPPHRPILHHGRCITRDKCVCKSRKAKSGCQECNTCGCKAGKVQGCTKKGCPDANTEQGAAILAAGGCYRASQTGICVYYSTCPDKSNKGQCGCQDCPSQDDLIQMILNGEGGWGEVNDLCTFSVPGPQMGGQKCEGVLDGNTSCNQCNKCECVNGQKICTSKTCPQPKYGCVVERNYPWTEKRCYFVSPCPGGERRCNFLYKLPEVTTEHQFCYMFNADKGRCEFMIPCPKPQCDRAAVCNACNRCTCKEGKVTCQTGECGDPLRQGCWTNQSGRCILTSPCPWDSYGHECSPEDMPTDADIKSDGCWAPNNSKCTFYYPCPF